jgi:2-methylisocitrate lyase-like PEP mutase family enzyme
MNQFEKGQLFAELHRGPLFVMANPWDAGSARLLAGLGMKALATTSAGFAWTLGRRDMGVSRDEALANAAQIAAAVDLPVSGDLENGYGDDPADAAETIRRLQAYEAAGADVLFAPGLPDLDAIRTVVASIGKPLNVVLWQKQSPYTIGELAAAGVRRVSTGGSFARAAYSGLRDAALEVLGPGTLSYLDNAVTTAEVHSYLPAKA